MAKLSVVGKSVPRIDALEKVTGKAKFAGDFKVAGMLHVKVLRSPYAHARIVSIDTSKAEKLPGVRAVVTGKDAPDVRIGMVLNDQYVLCRDSIVRSVGESVVAVAADTVEIAEEALDLIDVNYEELPAVFDPEEAMEEDPPTIIHPDLPSYTSPAPYIKWGFEPGRPNVLYHYTIRNGDVERGFEEADLIVENRFSTCRVVHGQLETHQSIAWVEADGTVVVRTKTQQSSVLQQILARLFSLPVAKMRIIAPYVGGDFGGGSGVLTEPITILLAMKSGRPVKFVYTREEQFVDGRQQVPIIVYIKDGVKKDGTLVARKIRTIQDSGRHSEMALIVARNSAFGAVGTYRIPNFRLDNYAVYTNNPLTGVYRGLGAPQMIWAIEQQMDIIAEKLGIDPIEIRKKNILREGDRDVLGQITYSIGVEECLDKVAEWIEWSKKPAQKEGPWRKGKGIAIGQKYTMAGTSSVAVVKVHPDETIEVRHGTDELGQGSNTVIAQIAAEEFGVTLDHVNVVRGDTAFCPYDFGAVSSRATFHVGNAVIRACRDAKRQILEMAAGKLGVLAADLEIREGKILVTRWPGKWIKIGDLFNVEGVPISGGEILGRGSFYSPMILEDRETGGSERMLTYFTHVAHAVEVEVNVETGEVKVLRVAGAFDAKPINPKLVEQQIEGGIGQGISLVYEQVALENGVVINPNFVDYKMATMTSLPSNENSAPIIVPTPHRDGPFGAKGVGEAGLVPIAPAISNAVYNATGLRIKDLPILREKVVQGIREAQKVLAMAMS